MSLYANGLYLENNIVETVEKFLNEMIHIAKNIVNGTEIYKSGHIPNIISITIPNKKTKILIFSVEKEIKPKNFYLTEHLLLRKEKLVKKLSLKKENGEIFFFL